MTVVLHIRLSHFRETIRENVFLKTGKTEKKRKLSERAWGMLMSAQVSKVKSFYQATVQNKLETNKTI